MSNRLPPKTDPSAAALLLLAGAAVGAAVALVVTSPLREKLMSSVKVEFDANDLLGKVTQTLQKNRDRVVDAVDSLSNRRAG